MSKRLPAPRRLSLSLSLILLCSPAWACGPDFPTSLLEQRQQTLGELPEGSFDYEGSSDLSPQPATMQHFRRLFGR